MTEPFDAVLAEVERETSPLIWATIRKLIARLAAAHEAEVAERDRMVGEQLAIAERAKAEALRQQQERLAAITRADAAVALLRDVVEIATREGLHLFRGDCPDSSQPDARDHECAACRILMKTDAFLSEQAGERENGDG